jgi:predicted nucleic acid-binding protein
VGELLVGFLGGGRARDNEAELAAFLASPVVHELFVDRETARVYAEIWMAAGQAGMPLPTNDVWIAACAAQAGASLLTFDAHFAAIGRIGTILLEARE